MKKHPLLHADLSAAIARLGHNDQLAIGDAGMPIPPGPQRIDLALTGGIPSFLDTLRVVASEMVVQSVIVAEEILTKNPTVLAGIREVLPGVEIEMVPHLDLKERTKSASAMVRTGEFTPYANVILVAGVAFTV